MARRKKDDAVAQADKAGRATDVVPKDGLCIACRENDGEMIDPDGRFVCNQCFNDAEAQKELTGDRDED